MAGAAPMSHHLDRRASQIAEAAAGNDDLQHNTKFVADWLGVSVQWLEIGRCRGYGPKFIRISPRMIRYRRGDVLQWLRERAHARTSEYQRKAEVA
jgi:predicted DNA-binding transcriptional regulator AlpA